MMPVPRWFWAVLATCLITATTAIGLVSRAAITKMRYTPLTVALVLDTRTGEVCTVLRDGTLGCGTKTSIATGS